MEMEIIDTVRADTLDVQDLIAFGPVVCEIKEKDDEGDLIRIVSEDDREVFFIPFEMVDIFGYAEVDI